MCYTVVVASSRCCNNHARVDSGTLCWRQCDKQAKKASESGKWYTTCDDIQTKKGRETNYVITDTASVNIEEIDCSICQGDDAIVRGLRLRITYSEAEREARLDDIEWLSEEIQQFQKTDDGVRDDKDKESLDDTEEKSHVVEDSDDDFEDAPEVSDADENLHNRLLDRQTLQECLKIEKLCLEDEIKELEEEVVILQTRLLNRQMLLASRRDYDVQTSAIKASGFARIETFYCGRVSMKEKKARKEAGFNDYPRHLPAPNSRVDLLLDNFKILWDQDCIESDELAARAEEIDLVD